MLEQQPFDDSDFLAEVTGCAAATYQIPGYSLIKLEVGDREIAYLYYRPYFAAIRTCISSASTASISPRR
jgi:hypothetical protein